MNNYDIVLTSQVDEKLPMFATDKILECDSIIEWAKLYFQLYVVRAPARTQKAKQQYYLPILLHSLLKNKLKILASYADKIFDSPDL